MANASDEFWRQAGGFMLVGGFCAGLDIVLFNFLTSRLQWSKIRANLVSVSLAMTFSFLANWHWVFPAHGGHPAERAVRFLVVTLASGWLVQNGVIRLLDAGSLELLTRAVGPTYSEAKVNLLHRNLLKAAAVGAGMFCNYAGYRLWVFA